MIEDFKTLGEAVLRGQTDFRKHGEVYTRVSDDDRLILFKYLPTCAFRKPYEWTWLETVSRGLIMDRITGKIVARPFDKFWNYDQFDEQEFDEITGVYEKADGSLLIGFHHPQTHAFRFATNGSFYSDQAIAANKLWVECGLRPIVDSEPDYTLLAEYISPDNRIVVDYKDFRGFIILGMRNNETGEYLSYENLQHWFWEQEVSDNPNIRLVRKYDTTNVDELLEWCRNAQSANDGEGFVVHDANGNMFKIKSAVYLQVHKLVSMINEKNIHEAMVNGKADEFREAIPDEFIGEYDQIRDIIEHRVRSIVARVSNDLDEISDKMGLKDYRNLGFKMESMRSDRKQFAMFAKKKKFPGYLFFALDSEDAYSIYQRVLNDYMKLVKKGVFPEIVVERSGGMYD